MRCNLILIRQEKWHRVLIQEKSRRDHKTHIKKDKSYKEERKENKQKKKVVKKYITLCW